jgi:hypothetical protein
MTRPPDLIYSVDETPPRAILVGSAVQHVAVMAITLIFPIILAREAKLSGAQFKLAPGGINREAVEQFLSEQGARWAARRDVIRRAIFGVVQVREVLGDPPGGVVVEASFGEFNLDIRIRYVGAPLAPGAQAHATRNRGGKGRRTALAGYLLRQTADRIYARGSTEAAEMTLHYDH